MSAHLVLNEEHIAHRTQNHDFEETKSHMRCSLRGDEKRNALESSSTAIMRPPHSRRPAPTPSSHREILVISEMHVYSSNSLGEILFKIRLRFDRSPVLRLVMFTLVRRTIIILKASDECRWLICCLFDRLS